MSIKDVLLNDAPKLALMAMAAKAGGPQAAARFMEGQQQRAVYDQHQQRQQMQDMRADELHLAQMGNIQSDNERLAQQQEMAKLRQALEVIERETQRQGETATDPVQAENNIMRQAATVASLHGLPPDALTGMVPNMSAPITGRKKKLAQDMYERAVKTYGEEAIAGDSVTLQTGEVFGDVKPSQLRAMFAPPAVDDKGAAVAPYVKPENQGVPTTERLALAAFAKERGKTPDQLGSQDLLAFNKSFKQSDDRPPLHVTVGDSGLTPRQIQAAAGLRDDFRLESKDFSVVRSAYDRVVASAKDPSAAGDMALLFNYMKILDPNSVVRETEFRTAALSGSLPQQIQAVALRVVNGQRLTESQRADFVDRAQKLYGSADIRQKRLMDRYRNIATKSGVPAELVVIDTGDLSVPDQADTPTAGANANPNQGIEDALRAQGITGRVVAVRPK